MFACAVVVLFFYFLMAAISFDGTLPVCSCAYVNVRGRKGALQKSFFLFKRVGGIFFFFLVLLYVFICMPENLRVAEEWVCVCVGGGSEIQAKTRRRLPARLSSPLRQHDGASQLLITVDPSRPRTSNLKLFAIANFAGFFDRGRGRVPLLLLLL